MKHIVLSLFMTVSVSGCTKFFESKESNPEVKAEKEEVAILSNLLEPETAILYSIEPLERSNSDGFHGFKVLGKTIISTEHVSDVALEFKEAAEAYNQSMGEMMCFNPRHGIRITKNKQTYDFLLCYECQKMVVYYGDKQKDFGVAGNPKNLNEVLTAANIPLSIKK